jgi:uncharacterized protein YprB with RNaseH-like and TPR domain
MANLRDRLSRIREQKKTGTAQTPRSAFRQDSADITFFEKQGWKSCGYMSLKREIILPEPAELPEKLPPALIILIPDLERICGNGIPLPKIGDFLFFDLETSGLSGGAGTVAFLAAFGRLVKISGKVYLRITQYLLLDYPGENDFLEALLGEFNDDEPRRRTAGYRCSPEELYSGFNTLKNAPVGRGIKPLSTNKEQIIVSYNGKCFDSQILKTRCLMNRIKSPEYFHADLLHPARRLWKTVLDDCSQGTIETNILGLDRTGDISGALAPEIWFDFLKTGNAERLMGICDHNCRDIAGLSAILYAMSRIAEDPLIMVKKYRYDIEQLALRWRSFLRHENETDNILHITGTNLLRLAAKQKCPRALLVYSMDQLRGGNYKDGRKLLSRIVASDFTENIRAAALRALAIDSERRLKNITEALEFTRQGLEIQLTGCGRKEFEYRCKRLEQKIVVSG